MSNTLRVLARDIYPCDTQENWNSAAPILSKGMVAKVIAPDDSVTFKVGDGETAFADLPSYAKDPTKPNQEVVLVSEASATGTWTITNLIPRHPVYVAFDCLGQPCDFTIAEACLSHGVGAQFALGHGDIAAGGVNLSGSVVLIPSGNDLKLNILAIPTGQTVKAFQ